MLLYLRSSLTNLRLLTRYLFLRINNLRRDKVHLLFDAMRWPKPFLVACSFSLIFTGLTRSTALAQKSLRSITDESFLLDAARPQQSLSPAGANDSEQTGTGSITGTVLDTNRDVLQGARVTLAVPSGSPLRTIESGMNGQFAFTGLPPDVYKVTVTAPGMSTFASSQIPLLAGEARILAAVTLPVSAVSTSVTVTGESRERLSQQQVQIAAQQRIGGIIPNFYSAYDQNAPPLLAKQKFQLSIRSIFDPTSFLGVAGIAGAEQYQNVFPAYGSGIEGYGKRYAAAFANHVSGNLLGRAIYPSIFHQDPRYFYKGKGTIRSRVLYSISAAVISRAMMGRGDRITHECSAISQRQPFRVFTIRLPSAERR